MNSKLIEEIIRHIMSNLGIIKSDFINYNKTKSLIENDFLLSEKLIFDVDGSTIKNNIWGCQIGIENSELKIILGDCSQDGVLEYCLIIQLKNAPTYGLYFIDLDNLNLNENMIACSIDNSNWMICNTYLQATFLAGMEQIKDSNLSWKKCSSYKEQYDMLLSFIKYHQGFCEENYEG